MVYTHVVKDLRNPATSPLDILHRQQAREASHEPPEEGVRPDERGRSAGAHSFRS